MRISRFVVLAALAAVCAVGPRVSQASEVTWVTERLLSTAGAATKTFAGAHDSAFYRLPPGINHDYVFPNTAAVYAWGRLTFRVTGAAAANADTLRYRIIPQVGGVRSYVNLAEQTAAVGNIALQPLGTMTGLLFEGVLLGRETQAANASVFPTRDNSILKVVGDSNGAFNSVEVWITYPKRAASRGTGAQ